MVRVIGVRFRTGGKMYYFDPNEADVRSGDNVIVETARGLEYGTAVCDIKEVDESELVQPLKPIIRIADENDRKAHEATMKRHAEALRICEEKIAKRGLEMKLIDVEYTFDNSKVIFYFTADGRVDFRELVKDLASAFRMRIELRQIGVRDETKMMGGIGPCGRDLCCHSWLDDFETVSIKMAKVQNLSLNPSKISGICGRLMCCLQYENDTYIALKKGMPDIGEYVMTPEGRAVVDDVNILQSKVKTRLILEEGNDGKSEKLSAEYYLFGKDEITRDGKKRGGKQADGQNRNLNKEAEASADELAALED
ncbi:MAG: stage 0 sporulation family protein [Firmicutes bacterium]|nr:stage 0 sporulation family protein [Bacillota bacterium]